MLNKPRLGISLMFNITFALIEISNGSFGVFTTSAIILGFLFLSLEGKERF